MRNWQIARRPGVSLDAVKFHIANALDKLGLDSRAALRHWAGVPADSRLPHPPTGGESTVDDDLRLGSIGQILRVVSDIPRAVDWYGGVLGLQHLYTFGDLAFFDCAGTRLFLSLPENGSVPKDQTVLYFRVTDIHAAHEQLTARGVKFESAPHMIFRHDTGMEEWMAFFTDPDGGTLAVMAQVPG
jgi:catechol 2,3-dioxygenase-like lactoylglutathione lyase family enzyme